MFQFYPKHLKKQLCEEVCNQGKSTLKTAEDNSIPVKTLEKWITAFHKDPTCFDYPDNTPGIQFTESIQQEITSYDDLSKDDLKKILMRKDIEIARLKKGYLVKGSGQSREFVTFSKKNMK